MFDKSIQAGNPAAFGRVTCHQLETKLETKKEKQMKNEVTISGSVKAIKVYENERGTMLTGWLNHRDVSRTSDGTVDRVVYVAGMNIIALDKSVVKDILAAQNAGHEETGIVNLVGRLVTKFDRRQIAEADKRAPYLQLEVHAVEFNN
jgi:hypothetical protein